MSPAPKLLLLQATPYADKLANFCHCRPSLDESDCSSAAGAIVWCSMRPVQATSLCHASCGKNSANTHDVKYAFPAYIHACHDNLRRKSICNDTLLITYQTVILPSAGGQLVPKRSQLNRALPARQLLPFSVVSSISLLLAPSILHPALMQRSACSEIAL